MVSGDADAGGDTLCGSSSGSSDSRRESHDTPPICADVNSQRLPSSSQCLDAVVCVVCREAIRSNQAVAVFPCKHQLHWYCFQGILDNCEGRAAGSCPCCRTPFGTPFGTNVLLVGGGGGCRCWNRGRWWWRRVAAGSRSCRRDVCGGRLRNSLAAWLCIHVVLICVATFFIMDYFCDFERRRPLRLPANATAAATATVLDKHERLARKCASGGLQLIVADGGVALAGVVSFYSMFWCMCFACRKVLREIER